MTDAYQPRHRDTTVRGIRLAVNRDAVAASRQDRGASELYRGRHREPVLPRVVFYGSMSERSPWVNRHGVDMRPGGPVTGGHL